MNTLQYDVEFDNAMFFGYYVRVLTDGKMTGGGLVGGYNEAEVIVGGRPHLRQTSTFVQVPPPRIQIDFV